MKALREKRFAFYCACGGSLTGSADDDKARFMAEQIWQRVHRGEGHAETTAATWARNRRKADAVGPAGQ